MRDFLRALLNTSGRKVLKLIFLCQSCSQEVIRIHFLDSYRFLIIDEKQSDRYKLKENIDKLHFQKSVSPVHLLFTYKVLKQTSTGLRGNFHKKIDFLFKHELNSN